MQQIDLKYFQWNSAFKSTCLIQDTHQLGFIAQEIQQVFPNSVFQTSSYGYDDFCTLENGQIQAMHFGATKQLMTVVESQSTQLQEQSTQLMQQSTQIAKLLADNSTLTGLCSFIPQLLNTVSTLKG